MSRPVDHPAFPDMAEKVANALRTKQAFLLPPTQLVFVCGGPVGPGENSVRQQFLDWARTNVPDCRFFLAEAAIAALNSRPPEKFRNLSKFEALLATLANCVILFPESVGSWAETGVFSTLGNVREKCLIANSQAEQGDSFLNLGPIHQIDSWSRYTPKITLQMSSLPQDISMIKERLDRSASSRRKRIDITGSDFDKLPGIEQIAIALFLISLFPSINIQGLFRIFTAKIFSRYSRQGLERVCPLLLAAEYVERLTFDPSFLFVRAGVSPLLTLVGVDQRDFLLPHQEFYRTHAPDYVPRP